MVLASLGLLAGCRSVHAPAAVEPEVAICVTAKTVLLAGIDLDRLANSPLGAAGGVFAGHPSHVWVVSDGKELVVISRGNFREAPPGSRLIKPGFAISGPADQVDAALAQHNTGTTGAPDMISHAGTVAMGMPIWAVARGGVTLPLTGNAANLNRLLRLVDYATLTAKLDASLDIDLAGVCRNAEVGQRFEETMRAILSLAGAANPRLDSVLHSAEIRRDGPVVHVTLSSDADSAAKLIEDLIR
jgi:hypothetical protein